MMVFVVGGGGHAKVVIATLQAAGLPVGAAFDDDPSKWGRSLLGVPIQGPIDDLPRGDGSGAVLAIGDNRRRLQMSQRLAARGVSWATVIHPTAYVHPTVRVGPGTVVFANATIQPDTVVGAHVVINTAASVDHDCVLGDFVHVAPGVHLAGGVVLDEGVLMGIGSAAIPGTRVGAWSTAGAGAVVVRDLGADVTAVGVPAKVRQRGRS
jgi:sugar O-acyltransferase (sialic acid O-acetyltransferase NeuD family)